MVVYLLMRGKELHEVYLHKRAAEHRANVQNLIVKKTATRYSVIPHTVNEVEY